ncbi:MAG: bifunctional diaminohydroxyphosphoribosylaminopyrimidine deaminase/5-amino-6-(5-phosphoribosylamino)uracil reductase RibD [Candidatus Nanopelagicales bacterium]
MALTLDDQVRRSTGVTTIAQEVRMATAAEFDAMRLAISLAQSADFPPGPNPRVGCVIVDPQGVALSSGAHEGAGTPHAEVVALGAAGTSARGATAVVTLEPCAHTGRTGPCTQALIDAGIARVVFAQQDPNPAAAGGAAVLREAGLDVESGILAEASRAINPKWSAAVARGWPFVTLKIAASLDGKIAAPDGSSRWITGEAARHQVHALRSESGAVMVGIGTVIADDPALTDRRVGASYQPIPVVIGHRDVPATSKLAGSGAITLRTHDLAFALRTLYERGIRSVLVEGGPTISTALLREGLVDELIWYVAPCVAGGGLPAVQDLGVTTIDQMRRLTLTSVTQVGEDIRIDMLPARVANQGGED